ncbi:IucA/IucC family protein [Actinomadura hibisca]|uniref:IucA/IucC family protein n=1 Tax=Actinomadura hibisca TaxID=68565 RepID=UPI0008369025|nr:IucA/IucC family protein [Actinomadura hibisca]
MNCSVEGALAARILDTLLREDYGGLSKYVDPYRRTLEVPGIVRAKLRGPSDPPAGGLYPGFLSYLVVDAEQRLWLGDVLAVVRRLAHPGDDVAAFEQECREALTTVRLHEETRPVVLDRLAEVPDGLRRGPGTFYETLAAYRDHPVHPAGRARLGLSPNDLRRYAPEFDPAFTMSWVAVPQGRVTAAGERPDWWPGPQDVGLEAALAATHDLLPVHPLTEPLLRDEPGLVPGRRPYLQVMPTLSMRTVTVEPLEHLKIPMPTSTLGLRNRRTIVPGTLPDGARAERILRRVLAREPWLPVLLADEQTYGHAESPLLGYLVRRFPAETARAHVVPVAALLADSPDGGAVVQRWNVTELFGSYLDVLLSWNVALFRHGIALEAHQQNISLVMNDTGPPKLLLKDNDGMLLDPHGRAARYEPRTAFHDRRMSAGDPEALARVFVTITLHLCAAALAFGLAERGLLPLGTGLTMIRDRLDACLGPDDRLLRARTLDAPALPAKAMVTAGTLVDKARTGAADINKAYGPLGPNYLRDASCY